MPIINLNNLTQCLVWKRLIQREKTTLGKLDEWDNALQDDSVYKLVATLYLNDDSVEESEITFKTNSAPHFGNCSVTPESGYAVTTEFTISCQGWSDEDLPLCYEFR